MWKISLVYEVHSSQAESSPFILVIIFHPVYFRCGKCRRFMKFIQAKPSRLHCSNCDDTFTLPQNGNIKLYKELKCPLDDYELVLWTTGVKGKVMLYISKSGNNFLMYFRLKVEI